MRSIPFLPEKFIEISAHLKRGGVVIFPTESSYGFSGRLDSPKAVARVEAIKQRQGKAFLCLVPDFDTMEKLTDTSYLSEGEREKSLHTPTTFLLPKSQYFLENFPEYFPNFTKVGIRKTLYKPLEGFLRFFDHPIFSTSANLSGMIPLYKEDFVRDMFNKERDILFVSAGDLPENPPSKILNVENSKIETIR